MAELSRRYFLQSCAAAGAASASSTFAAAETGADMNAFLASASVEELMTYHATALAEAMQRQKGGSWTAVTKPEEGFALIVRKSSVDSEGVQ